MTTFARRRPITWLAFLIAFNLVLLSIQARNDQGQRLIRGWAMAAVTPVVYALTGSAGWVSDSVSTFSRLYSAEQENQRLRRENARLRLETHRLKGFSALWLRSRELSRLKSRYDFDTVTAGVIGRSAPFFQERILINVGTGADIRPNSAVIHSEGIVGRVVSANILSAEVETITNAGAALGGIVEGSGLQGVARGDGSELLIFDFVPNFEDVPVGAIIRSSGWDRIYPAGLPIGKVVTSRRGAMIYREIRVKPFVDSSRIQEVLTVKRKQSTDSALPRQPTATSEQPEG